MDYQSMAKELLAIRAKLVKAPVHRMMDEFVHGTYFVLNYLCNHDGKAYPKDLSRKMSVSTARIAALLKQMEKKEWITRTSDTADSRQTIVTLTDKGNLEITKRKQEIIDAVACMLEGIGPKDTHELLRIQRKMLNR